MYSVLRVTGTPEIHQELSAITASINAATPGSAARRGRGDGFAVEIASSAEWDEHVRALSSFMHTFADQLARANHLGANVTFDVAVEPDDRRGRPFHSVHFEAALLSQLSTVGVAVEVTSYP